MSIYLARFGILETTQSDIVRAVEAARDLSRVSPPEPCDAPYLPPNLDG